MNSLFHTACCLDLGKRKLHNEELYYLYFSHNIIRVMKSQQMESMEDDEKYITDFTWNT